MLDKVIISNDTSYNKIIVTITGLTKSNTDYKIQPYEVNLITGNINKRGRSKLLKIMLNTGCKSSPQINLTTVDKKTIRVNYYQLLTYLRLKVGLIKKVEYQYIINKHLNYLDGHIYNLLYLNGLESVYYKDRDNFNKYIKNRVCIIDPNYSVFDAIKDGLVVVKPINVETNYVGEFYIDTNGIMVNNNTGMYVNRHTNSFGYISFTYTKGNSVYNKTTINILGRTFLRCGNGVVYGFKDNSIPRANTELINIYATTKNELTKRYHKNNTDHYDKYLKNHEVYNTSDVMVNGMLFNSFKDAAMYIIKEEEQLGNTRTLTSVVSLISLRVNNKLKNSNRKIYNRYTITKGG